jgi:hypothetical protein
MQSLLVTGVALVTYLQKKIFSWCLMHCTRIFKIDNGIDYLVVLAQRPKMLPYPSIKEKNLLLNCNQSQ